MKEQTLFGGCSTADVVKRDDVVYRPHKTESDFANSFLQFFEVQGCPYSQRYLGRDDSGRDMYRYIKGDVPVEIDEKKWERAVHCALTCTNCNPRKLRLPAVCNFNAEFLS